MKKSIEIVASETVYANLSTFKNIEELNETVRYYKDQIAGMDLRQDVKRNLLTIMEYLKRHSCRFLGVSFKGKRKIAVDLQMSDRTIIRACHRLEKLGFIKQYAMKRSSDMQQTVNAIVFQPFDNGKKQSVRQKAEEMSDQKNNIPLKQDSLLHNTYQPSAPKTFYYQFKAFIQNTIGENQSLINRLFGVYKAQTAVLIRYGAYSKTFVEQAGYEALKTAVMATKIKNIRNLPGYFNGVLDQILDRMVHEEMQQILLEK